VLSSKWRSVATAKLFAASTIKSCREVAVLVCPKCETPININAVRQHFVCPKCSTKLSGHVWWPVILAIGLWSMIEALIAEALYSKFGHEPLIVALKIALSVAIGFPLFYFVVKKYGTIEVDNKPSRLPRN
jgi:hypothetical protein